MAYFEHKIIFWDLKYQLLHLKSDSSTNFRIRSSHSRDYNWLGFRSQLAQLIAHLELKDIFLRPKMVSLICVKIPEHLHIVVVTGLISNFSSVDQLLILKTIQYIGVLKLYILHLSQIYPVNFTGNP